MKNIIYTFLFLCTFGCVQTSYKYFSRKPDFRANDSILIGDVIGMNPNVSYGLFEWAQEKIDTSQHPVLYLSEQEYTLMSQGLTPEEFKQVELSRKTLQNLHSVLGVDYFLQAEIRPLGGIDNPLPPGNSYEATVAFHLYHLLNDTYSYHYRIKTRVNPFEMPDDTGLLSGMTINTSSEEKAAVIAFKKGWKKLMRGMPK